MKASAFAYARATSVANALELLTAHGERAKLLSGGQSLMPAMNLRLISPELVIDIGELAELRGIAVKRGILTIGDRFGANLNSSTITDQAKRESIWTKPSAQPKPNPTKFSMT